jgi:hypothetical protein
MKIRNCQQACKLYEARRGGWCVFYHGTGSDNDLAWCDWDEKRNGEEAKTTALSVDFFI